MDIAMEQYMILLSKSIPEWEEVGHDDISLI